MSKLLILGKNGRLSIALNKVFADLKPIALDKEDLDLFDLEKTQKTILEIKPDIIINASAITDVDKCETDEAVKQDAYKLNGQAPGYIARISKKINAIFIHFSTDNVFDGTKNEPYLENYKPNPINVYGKTKLLGEELINSVYDKYYIIRTSWLWGEGANFITWSIHEIINTGKVKLFYDQFSKLTNVYDLAGHVKLLIENKPDFGIYHFVNEGVVSRSDIGETMKDFLIKNKNFRKEINIIKIKTDDLARPAKMPANGALENSKFQKMRNWQEPLLEYLNKIKC